MVVGAGASLAQAKELGTPDELCPPLMSNFARKMWSNYSPYPLLERYLKMRGVSDLGRDPREKFYELELVQKADIESFLEFAWNNRNVKIKVPDVAPPGFIYGLMLNFAATDSVSVGDSAPAYWENLQYHGLGDPLSVLISQAFFENGIGFKDLPLTRVMMSKLRGGDMLLNLNYDTLCEIALSQNGTPISYLPNVVGPHQIAICKPHGSLNMIANDVGFAFGPPDWLGQPQPPGFKGYSGLMPPRLHKSYSEHPISAMILAPARLRMPTQLVLWGTGLTMSDIDLMEIYRSWGAGCDVIDVINPSDEVAHAAERLFERKVRHYRSAEPWFLEN